MNCPKAIERLTKLLGEILKHIENSFLSDEDIKTMIQEIEKCISYLKNNCREKIGIDILNKLEFLVKALKHFFNIRLSVDERIKHHSNLIGFIKIELLELIEELKNV